MQSTIKLTAKGKSQATDAMLLYMILTHGEARKITIWHPASAVEDHKLYKRTECKPLTLQALLGGKEFREVSTSLTVTARSWGPTTCAEC